MSRQKAWSDHNKAPRRVFEVEYDKCPCDAESSRPSVILIAVLGIAVCGTSAVECTEPARQIARPETIQRMSGESEEQFALRKQRITYGTPENRRYCKEELSINVGLCKGGA